jgi:hypothetical protein
MNAHNKEKMIQHPMAGLSSFFMAIVNTVLAIDGRLELAADLMFIN